MIGVSPNASGTYLIGEHTARSASAAPKRHQTSTRRPAHPFLRLGCYQAVLTQTEPVCRVIRLDRQSLCDQ